MTEKWQEIPGWSGLYEASNLGRIRSKIRRHKTILGEREYGGKVLKPIKKSHGYCVVNLTNSNKIRKQELIHRLILQTFCGENPRGTEACHNNGKRSDNRLENLRWDTRKSNHLDKKSHGTWQGGSNNPTSKLSEAQAKEIKYSKKPHKFFMEKFGVSKGCIEKIKYRQNWRHV